MLTILMLTILQAPDDLAGFLAALEKDREKGATCEELLKKIDAWAAGKPRETQARLAWNRELLQSTLWVDALRRDWLTRHVGERVTLANSTGIVKEVKAASVVLDTLDGAKEVHFRTLGPEDGLAEIKNEKLQAGPAPEEAVLRFAAGKIDAALALARAFESVIPRSRALRAFVGWALQSADRFVAEGKPVRAAEFLAAGWTKHVDLMEAGDGALHHFVHTDLLQRLYDEADKLAPKDRKEARRILDLVPTLSKSKEVLAKVHGLRFTLLDSNQWYPILLEEQKFRGDGEYKDGKIGWEDTIKGADLTSTLALEDLPFPWDQVSGVRARLRHAADYIDMRLGFGATPKYQLVCVFPKEGKSLCGTIEGRGGKIVQDTRAKAPTKPEYLLRFEQGKDFWKIFVDAQEVKLFKPEGGPVDLLLVVNEGKCELMGLEFRRK
jgi:hypothetical protein